jgi:hypothetical protein
MTEFDKVVKSVTQLLMDEGKLIEMGWKAFELQVMPITAGKQQRHDMRVAFFSGAQHLFGSIISGLDEDPNPTPADERRLEQIDKELRAFTRWLKDEMAQRLQRQTGVYQDRGESATSDLQADRGDSKSGE